MKKLVMVDVLTSYRMRYAVEVEDDIDHALDEVVCNIQNTEFIEFSQKHLGDTIISHREINKDEYLKMFDEDNDYLKEWTEQHKFDWINSIDYSKT